MKAKDVMTREVRFVRSDAPILEAAALMANYEVSALPVFRGDLIVGVVSERDIVRRGLVPGGDPRRVRVEDVMSKQVPCCYEEQDLAIAANIMSAKGGGPVLVVDAWRRPVGVVSVLDLADSGAEELALSVLRSSAEHQVGQGLSEPTSTTRRAPTEAC